MKYRFFKKGAFENLEKFELRLNQEAALGWRVVSLVPYGGNYMALLEKIGNERVY